MSEPIFSTRRQFVRTGLTLLAARSTVPAFLERTALAGEPPAGATPATDQRVLVVLQLAGGNDGLNTIVPCRNDHYYRARPQLAISQNQALRLTDDLALHPSASGLKRLYDEGLLSIVQGVGYPNPDRSHFKSTDIWETADPQQRSHSGWIGRYVDCTCAGAARAEPKTAIALTPEAPLSLIGDRFAPLSFGAPDELTWRPGRVSDAARDAFEELNAPGHGPGENRLDFLQRTALDARLSAREIQEAAGGTSRRGRGWLRGGGRGQLGQHLTMVARMIAAGLPTRVYYVSLGGFDTHAGQLNRHAQLMSELGDALGDFADALREGGQLDRVLLMTFSEFGRRVQQNASQGTDHGAAAPMFLVGPAVKPGMQGTHPNLDRLDEGDLVWTTDFRSVYADVLANWLGMEPKRVLAGAFKRVNLLDRR